MLHGRVGDQPPPPIGWLPSHEFAHHQPALGNRPDAPGLGFGEQLRGIVHPAARDALHIGAHDFRCWPQHHTVGLLDGQRVRLGEGAAGEVAAAAEEGALGVGQLVVLSLGL